MKEQLLQRGCILKYTQEANNNTTIAGEVSAMVQVVDNLIVNAMDAYSGKQGEIGLDISEDNKKVYIKVSDHAGGIPPRQISTARTSTQENNTQHVKITRKKLLFLLFWVSEEDKAKKLFAEAG